MTQHVLQSPRGQHGMAMHDPSAVAVVLDPSPGATHACGTVGRNPGERTLGMTVADRRAPERQAEAPATIEGPRGGCSAYAGLLPGMGQQRTTPSPATTTGQGAGGRQR